MPKSSIFHKPALLQEALTWLAVRPQSRYIDATVGGGGHAKAIVNAGGQVLGLDQDPDALRACPRLDNLHLVQTNFIHLKEVAKASRWFPVSGIIFDLGVSLHQLSTPDRGFSYKSAGPLDMRMDPLLPIQASDLVNTLPISQLSQIFTDYGEVPTAKFLAAKLVSSRPISKTEQLTKLTGKWSRQVFQALRIAVNDELGSLATALPQALDLLDSGGRLVVISWHSLEDRVVKLQFNQWESQGLGQILTPKPVVPTLLEVTDNPQSRSAKLRAFTKK